MNEHTSGERWKAWFTLLIQGVEAVGRYTFMYICACTDVHVNVLRLLLCSYIRFSDRSFTSFARFSFRSSLLLQVCMFAVNVLGCYLMCNEVVGGLLFAAVRSGLGSSVSWSPVTG